MVDNHARAITYKRKLVIQKYHVSLLLTVIGPTGVSGAYARQYVDGADRYDSEPAATHSLRTEVASAMEIQKNGGSVNLFHAQ